MCLLRPLVTGPTLATCVAASALETVLLLTGLAAVSSAIYLPTLSISICACFAHLVACNRRLMVDEVRIALEGRLDAFEANNLYTLITSRDMTEPIAVNSDYPEPPEPPGKVYRLYPNT